jgi:hypothetical protein
MDRGHGIFWGLALLGVGITFLLSEQGLLPPHFLYSWRLWWPGLLVAYGLVRLLRPRDASDIAGGFVLILTSFWFFANLYHWRGFTWNTSWPIVLMISGFGMMLRAILSNWMRDRTDPADFDPREKENSDVR